MPPSRNAAATRAFAVHGLTASGAFFALLSLVAAAAGELTAAWWWLAVTLTIDAIDGPLARRFRVTEVLPHWSGALLDHVVDYSTYAMIPAFILFQGGLIEGGWLYVAGAAVVVGSAIYYADTRMKVAGNFFKGFPAAWNMLVFTLFVVQPAQWVVLVAILASAVVMFLPVNFVHPVRVETLRPLNLFACAVWAGAGAYALWTGFRASLWLEAVILGAGVYLYLIGAVLQAFPRLAARRDRPVRA